MIHAVTDRPREGHGRSRFRWRNGDNRLDSEIIARRRCKELVARRRSNNFNFPGYTVGLPLVTAEAVSKLKAPSTNIASSLPVLIVPSQIQAAESMGTGERGRSSESAKRGKVYRNP